jgi:hypothetical protein
MKLDFYAVCKCFSQTSEANKKMISASNSLLPANFFDPAKIIAYILFGGIGFVAFSYGKKSGLFRPMIIGVALMLYPYFVPGTLGIYLVGIALTAILYFWREKE